ncbi:MAG: trypsin-like peptidase domain-containing protein [Candidatus Zixiibacteriota bacterium]
MRCVLVSLAGFFLIATHVVFGQSLAEFDKRSIVRIETPNGLGTGFVLSDTSLGYFLVTNKHVLQSRKTQQYFDSVFVRKNELSMQGKVIATEQKGTLYLSFEDRTLYFEHQDPNVDLVFVSLGSFPVGDTSVLNPTNYSQWLFAFTMDMVADRQDMKRLSIRDGTPVQIIGFSFMASQRPQFHISRFGHVALFSNERLTFRVTRPRDDSVYTGPISAEWLVLDITSRPGDSGGPVLALMPGTHHAWLIGLVQAGSELNEFCLAHPSYYIHDLVDSVRRTVGK